MPVTFLVAPGAVCDLRIEQAIVIQRLGSRFDWEVDHQTIRIYEVEVIPYCTGYNMIFGYLRHISCKKVFGSNFVPLDLCQLAIAGT